MKYLVLIFFLISFVSLSSLSISNAEARSLSPFMFELDESKVDDKLFFYVENGKSNLMVKNGETVTFPLVIISATSKPVSVDFHTTIGNEQMGSIKFPQGVNIRLEPSHMIMKPDVNQILNITVLVSEKAPSSKYDVKLVGVWKEEGKIPDFMGTSFSLHVGDDYDSDSINDKPSCGDSSSQVPLYGCGDLVTVRLDSPLKQIQSGIVIDEIQCRESLTLLLKHDGSPSCVKSETAEILKHRGWADRIMNNFCFGEYLPVCGEDNVTYGNQCYLEREHVELKYLGECENFILSDYNLDETEFLQIKNNMENVGYHICGIQLEENKILIKLNWIFEGSEPEKMILSNIPSNVKYEIKYLDGYANYFISKESAYSCED